MHLFLDLDNTVTESRTPITPEMFNVLEGFESLVLVSGASKEQMKYQLRGLKCEVMAQNGNDNSLFNNALKEKDKHEIRAHVEQFATILNDQLEDRGCQVSYSFVGHHAHLGEKKKFDPDASHRQAILDAFPLGSKRLEVKIGGTTCLDYFLKGCTKGTNISRYIKLKRWKPYECLYVGDALFPCGNDESVVGVIPTFPVRSPIDTLQFLT